MVDEEGGEVIHGPDTLANLFNELVEYYNLDQGQELLDMFECSDKASLRKFASELSDV